jgi:ABC-type dipeptide/oligopeptide/nickel transport system permease component
VGVAVPIFVLGVVFLLIFGLWLGWFPTMGEGNPNKLLDQVWHVVLPALTLGWMLSGFLVRAMRASVLEILHEDYVRTAAAKGLSFVTIVRKHVLRNALSGVVTVAGIYLGILLGGTVVIEEVFDRPGLGSLLIGAIRQHDFNLVQSGLVVFSLIVIAVNLCVDLSYGVIDPRIRYD